VADGHSILVIAYHMLAEDTTYQELGSQYFAERDRPVIERRLVRRLEGLGHRVNLEPLAA
jgi:hypothetical protein